MNALEMAQGHPTLEKAVKRSRAMLHRKAMTGAVTSMVPIPGMDLFVDATLMSKLIPQINQAFGLTPEQIRQMDPERQEKLQNAIATVGDVMVGRMVTRDLVLRAIKMVGVRLTTKQAVRYVPIAGQVAAASLGYAALRYLGEQHIRECVRVCLEAGHAPALPGPVTAQVAEVVPEKKRRFPLWLSRPAA